MTKNELMNEIKEEIKRRENERFARKLEDFHEKTKGFSEFFRKMCEDSNDEGMKEAIINKLLESVTDLTN